MSDVMTEDVLIEQAVAGQPLALERLLLLSHGEIADRIERRLPVSMRGTVSAEDILQETFFEAFQRIGAFKPQGNGSFQRWLTKMADNRLLDAIRAHRAMKRGGGKSPVDITPAGSDSIVSMLELMAVHERTPSRSIAGHEAAAAIHVALAGLKDDYREALRMRYVLGLPVAAVAEKMGRTERSIHKLCERGLEHLQAAMGRSVEFLTRK
jgi:RNA polymerase sigma-70 factor, ECF subfamily